MELPERARAILDFWFGPLDADGVPGPATMRRWFAPDAAFDASVRERFGPELERAYSLDAWERHPRGALARVILADQFPRNIHRGRPEAFAFDALALAVARRAIAAGFEPALWPIERAFLYMPFEHAEDRAVQDESVARFRALAAAAPARLEQTFASYRGYAENHRDVVARFGRFPHRNAVLGRPDTDEERAWLEAGAATWGQGG